MRLNPFDWLVRRWLQRELPRWSAAGVIRPEQQEPIRDQYAKDTDGLTGERATKLVLLALCTLLLTVALLLVTVDHWRSTPWPLKIGPTLALLAAAHASGYWYRFHQNQPHRGDWLFLLGTLLYGCAIGLWVEADRGSSAGVLPWAFFLWALGTLPLGLVLGSCRMLVLTAALTTAWFVGLMTIWHQSAYLCVGFAAFLVDWAYKNRSRELLTVALLSAILWWCLIPLPFGLGRQGFFWIAALGPMLMLVGLRHADGHPFSAVYEWAGRIVTASAVLAASLPSVTSDLMASENGLRFWLLGLAVVGAAIAFVPGPGRIELRRDWRLLVPLAAFTVLPSLVWLSTEPDWPFSDTFAAWFLAVIFNVAAVAVGVALVLRGVAGGSAATGCVGIAYLTAWAVLIVVEFSAARTTAAVVFVVAAAAMLAAAHYGSLLRSISHDGVSDQAR